GSKVSTRSPLDGDARFTSPTSLAGPSVSGLSAGANARTVGACAARGSRRSRGSWASWSATRCRVAATMRSRNVGDIAAILAILGETLEAGFSKRSRSFDQGVERLESRTGSQFVARHRNAGAQVAHPAGDIQCGSGVEGDHIGKRARLLSSEYAPHHHRVF